jgi:hypothetical protein
MAVSGPSPTSANLQSGCDFGIDMLAREVAMSGSVVMGSVALIGIVDIGGFFLRVGDGERHGTGARRRLGGKVLIRGESISRVERGSHWLKHSLNGGRDEGR